MEQRFQLPCEVENDVNCAGLAENFAGASKGTSISLCLTVGTGIGGAIIIDNKVFHGFSGSGCEIGYMHLPGGEFQDLGASSILVKKTAEYKNIPAESINGKYVFENAKKGDQDCIRAIDQMVEVLGMGIANICYVLNPEIIVLGGGIMVQKELLYDKILDEAISYSVAIIGQDVIDEINILNATKKGVTSVVEGLDVKPNLIVIDALEHIDTKGIPYESIIKGDAKCYSIAAASIVAKVTRDRIMREWDEVYPMYGFAKHKGYGTASHIAAIKEYGLCPLHRRSFVKNIV